MNIRRGECPLSSFSGYGTQAVCLLIALLWGVIYYLTPLQVDDLAFIGSYREWNDFSDSFSLEAWWNFVCEIRIADSARVGNILLIPSALWIPWKWIFPWLTGLFTAAMVYMAARYAFGRSLDWRSLGVIWILIAVFLPWRNFIVTHTYALNYVYASVLTLGLVWLIMNTRDWDLRFWTALPLVVVAGWWHEGFAATSLCGLGLVMLLRRGRMPIQWWILCLVYGVTVIFLVSSPLVVGRMAHESTASGRWLHPGFAYDSLMTVLLILSVIGFLFVRRGRARLAELFSGWKFPLFLTASITGTLLAIIFVYTPRVCFWPSLTSIISLGLLWRPLWSAPSYAPLPGNADCGRSGVRTGIGVGSTPVCASRKESLKTIFGIISIALATAHLLYVIDWQARYYHQDKELNSLIDSSGSGTVFYDVIPTGALPRLTLYYPSKEMWVTLFHYQCLSRAKGGRQIAVVPDELRSARPSEALRLEGNVPVYSTGDALFIDSQSVRWLKLPKDSLRIIAQIPEADFSLRDGRQLRFPAALFLYYFNEPGDTLLYLYPYDIKPSEVVGVNLGSDGAKIFTESTRK